MSDDDFACEMEREGLDRFLHKTGTVLDVFCPHCGADLVERKKVVLKLVNFEGKEGWIHLSPVLNVFDLESDIQLKENVEDQDLICPHCNTSLIEEGATCDDCKSRAARILISAYSERVPFYICMKTGCKWHGFKEEAKEKIMLDDSDEW